MLHNFCPASTYNLFVFFCPLKGWCSVAPRSLGLQDFCAKNENKSGAKFVRNRCENVSRDEALFTFW